MADGPLRVIVQIKIYDLNGNELPPNQESFLTIRSHPRKNSDPDARVVIVVGTGTSMHSVSVAVRELLQAIERCTY